MGARRRSLLGNKRTGTGSADDGADLLSDANTDEVPAPAAQEGALPPMEDPLTDPSASGPFMAEFLRKDSAGAADLLQAPPAPARSEPSPPPRSVEPDRHAQPTAPPVAQVAFDAAPARAPTPQPPPSRSMPEEGPPLVSFDQAPEPAPTDAAWGDGWSPQAGAPRPLSDAPVARELFGGSGYEELEDVPPPTEELPSGVMEDVGQSYSTPYSVPEPPPIPGLVDRFTPPPVQRTELGDRKRKPDYLPDTPSGAANRGYEPTPAPVAKRKAAPRADVEERGSSGPPMSLLLGIGAAAVLGIGMVLLAAALFLGPSGDNGSTEGPGLAPATGGTTVETRDDMRRKPAQLGTPDSEPVQPEPVAQPAPEPAPEPAGTAPQPAPDPKPQPKPAVPTAPAPKPAPEPDPKPAPAAAQGVLKIRANRRAMVYVNNQVVGFTPLDHKVAPGTWSVAAVLPGQPTTRQERNVSVSSAGGTSAVDFTF